MFMLIAVSFLGAEDMLIIWIVPTRVSLINKFHKGISALVLFMPTFKLSNGTLQLHREMGWYGWVLNLGWAFGCLNDASNATTI